MSKKGKKEEGTKKVFKLIGAIFLYAVIFAYILPLNPETLMHNWGIGIIGVIIFSVIYLISCLTDIEKLLLRPKKLYYFMITVSICFIVGDWTDFILFMRGG